MKKTILLFFLPFLAVYYIQAQTKELRTTINLNGTWDFEQTKNAFPPERYTRKIPVPGLVNLAEPKIEQYDTFFLKSAGVVYTEQYDFSKSTYEPRYSWYKRKFKVPKELQNTNAVLTILKSQYVTQAFINGIDVGNSISCYTPIDFPVTHAIKFGEENEILIRVGDRKWLPSEAAGSVDKEKVFYLSGIWDNVFVSFTDKFRINKSLVLPSVSEQKITIKLLIRNFYPSQTLIATRMDDTCQIKINIYEKTNGKIFTSSNLLECIVKRDNITEFITEIPMDNSHLWTPDDPFLYSAKITLFEKGKISDEIKENFGMRDFQRKGKHFVLNGKEIFLRGTNITLHRFFEDRECEALPWDSVWVRKLLTRIPKKLHWNAMRFTVGIAPKLWYDIADESGLLIQNEWFYWQNHGWDEQIRTEFTDWIWSDGSHPSIIIWDAINENWDNYIGNILIPELKELDNTRIWDAGHMTSENMKFDEMDEPHPYRVYGSLENFDEYYTKHPYSLGNLNDWPPPRWSRILESSSAQLVNEYGWMWLWRDGRPTKLMEYLFPYYLGNNSTTEERRFLQAYWLQLETEWLRTERSLAGVMSFCYLTNNYGFTGDWFIDSIKDLKPGPVFDWFAHCYSPTAVFIDLTDERYTKHIKPHVPGSDIIFNLVGINDYGETVDGKVIVKLLDSDGKEINSQSVEISVPPYQKQYIPTKIQLPQISGGYLILAEYIPKHQTNISPIISRRYIKIGEKEKYDFFNYFPPPLKY